MMTTSIPTYTCGWCQRRNLERLDDGGLEPHRIPTSNHAWCEGLKTYRILDMITGHKRREW